MTWLHPWALFMGAAAAGLPLAIHFLTRPRPRALPLSTVRFVFEALQQRRAARRLRDWIVLALRVAAVLALAFALARPLIGDRPPVAQDSSRSVRVVLLDSSQSMSAVSGGATLFERARAAAIRHLAYSPGLTANLVRGGAVPHMPMDRATSSFAILREELDRGRVLPERLNVQAALAEAGRILAEVGPTGVQRELVVISDFQRNNWATADFSSLPKETRITLESVSPGQKLANLAIVRAGPQSRVEVGREVRLEVDVGNYSAAAREVTIEVSLDGEVFRFAGRCPGSSVATLSTSFTPRAPGWLSGEARLVGNEDALSADDARPFVLEVERPPSILFISRERPDDRPSSGYFLESALLLFSGDEPPADSRVAPRFVRRDPIELVNEELTSASMIVLDHPGKLSDDVVRRIAALLARGRSVLYVACEGIDATNLELLSAASGSAWQLPVRFLPLEPGQSRRDLFLADVRGKDRPFRAFGDQLDLALRPMRFSGGLVTRRLEAGLADDLVASYSDRTAALVVSNVGAGTIAVWNADLGASTMPVSPAFVPFVGELAERLMESRRGTSTVACGEPIGAFLPPAAGDAGGLVLRGPPAAGENLGSFVQEPGGVFWRSPAAGPPGHYWADRGGVRVFGLASAAPAREEADLSPLDPGVLEGRLSGGRSVEFRLSSEKDKPVDELWKWLAVACVGCVIGEIVALKLFRS
jgi:hypothetical protein